MASINQRLRERKLVQWALAYLAGAWLVIQVLDALADTWSIPGPFLRGAQILLGLGFLPALVIAWYHGEKGRQRVSGPELLILASLLAVTAAVMGVWSRGESAADADSGDVAVPGWVANADQPSIAVLPFLDLSPAGDQAYLADGIAEEILNALASIPGVNVAARTSAFSFRGEGLDVRAVGVRLGVSTVLEGSVRRDADRLRVAVQLVDIGDGFQLWSDSYDRELGGVFEVQEDIATAIVRALQIELRGATLAPSAWASGTGIEAYQAYLRGRHSLSQFSNTGWSDAVTHFNRSLELDPEYAPAIAGLAGAHYMRGFFGVTPFAEAADLAFETAERALTMDDRLSEAHVVLGLLALYRDWDWDTAGRGLRRALSLNPNDAYARHGYADLLTVLGDAEGGLAQVELGRRADPLSPLAAFPVVGHLTFTGRHEDVLAELTGLRELFPSRPLLGDSFYRSALWHLGRFDEALAAYRRAWSDDPALAAELEALWTAEGPRAALGAWASYLAERYERGNRGELLIASLYGRVGDDDAAIEWLERAVDARALGVPHIPADPDFLHLHTDPRFQGLLSRLGIQL